MSSVFVTMLRVLTSQRQGVGPLAGAWRLPRAYARPYMARNGMAAAYCTGRGDAQPDRRVRVRYAPSPTGELHLGGLRTALYNVLWARKMGGDFVVRVEDTDRTRYVQGSIGRLLRHLQWLELLQVTDKEMSDIDAMEERMQKAEEGGGNLADSAHAFSAAAADLTAVIEPRGGSESLDGAVYVQSTDLGKYKKYAEELVAKGYAYRCFCSSERLEELRELSKKKRSQFIYDRRCLHLTEEQVREHQEAGYASTIRMKIPRDADVLHDDLVKGSVAFKCAAVDDQVILKSDGFPTYHLASVVDDHLLGISHVIRGEEWLPSVPKHVLLYRYFGWQAPKFAHLPLLLNKNGSKISKRQNDTSIDYYRTEGYEAAALLNYVALLGWTPTSTQAGKEVFSLSEMASMFEFDRVSKSGAMINKDKLRWLNSQHLRLLCEEKSEELLSMVLPIWQEAVGQEQLEMYNQAYRLAVLRLITKLSDYAKASYFFLSPDYTTEVATTMRARVWKDTSEKVVGELASQLAALPSPAALADINAAVEAVCQSCSVSVKDVYMPARYLLTGTNVGAAVPETIEVLGVEECRRRLQAGLAYEAGKK